MNANISNAKAQSHKDAEVQRHAAAEKFHRMMDYSQVIARVANEIWVRREQAK